MKREERNEYNYIRRYEKQFELSYGTTLTIRTDGSITTELVTEVPAQDTARDYIVQKNDSLSKIAARELGDQNRWIDIYNHNLNKLRDPNALPVGTRLVLP